MEDPVGGFARAPISTTNEAFGDLVGDNRRLVFWGALAVFAVTLPVVVLEWLRPFDIRTISDPRAVTGLALIAGGSVLVAVIASRLRSWVNAIAVVLTLVALAPLTCLAALTLLTGGRDTVSASKVPGTGASIAVIDSGGDADEVVLRSKWGPIPRERIVLDLEGCDAFIRATGERSARLQVTYLSSSCSIAGDYLVTVHEDGWSTSIERTG